MKKIEVCVPVNLLEPLRAELAACGIVAPALMISCGWLDPGDLGPAGRKAPKASKAHHCKVELVVSDRLAPRAVQILSDLLLTHKGTRRTAALSCLMWQAITTSSAFRNDAT